MRFLTIFLTLLFILTACSTTTQIKQQEQSELKTKAWQLMQNGNYIDAAKTYLILAEKDKKNISTYRLEAATAYTEAGKFNEADAILNEIIIPQSNTLQNIRFNILKARLKLEFGESSNALNYLNALSSADLPNDLNAIYHDILSRAYFSHGNYLRAASERLRRQNFLTAPAAIEENHQLLWKIFETIPADDLDDLRLIAPEELISWFELASLYQNYRFRPNKLKNAVAGWVKHYPDHPAYFTIVIKLVNKSMQFITRPGKIGLLLPLSNQHKKSSIAIRDGFLAAWYLDNNRDSEITIYDAETSNIVEVYQQAVADGADYIVGPLEKKAVNRLSKLNELPVEILALNQHDTTIHHDNLFQFALSPEEEANQIAKMAMSDGHSLALIIAPRTAWGQRIADAFKQHWIKLGGGILEHVFYESHLNDFATPVKELLNIDSSETRRTALKNKLNIPIHSVERRRQDADFIFTVAVPVDARQLLPQLRFYHADKLPIYATSHIFSGVINRVSDIDINGVIFTDMPWILDTKHQLSIIQDALNRNWKQDKSNYRRLYALGIDAYRLIPELKRLEAEKNSYLIGETGDLSISRPDNVIKRKLQRAQFVDGKPVLLN